MFIEARREGKEGKGALVLLQGIVSNHKMLACTHVKYSTINVHTCSGATSVVRVVVT
jgi:hypothetical protein